MSKYVLEVDELTENIISKRKCRVYLAGGWFTPSQEERLYSIKNILEDLGYNIFFPKEEALCSPDSSQDWRQEVFEGNCTAIKSCDFIVCITDEKDMGCFTGDTKIELLDGRSVPIKDLHWKEEGYWVYSYNQNTGEIEPGFTHGSKLTRISAPIVEVVLDNGEIIKCTEDHPFMLRSGEYTEAKDLHEGDALMPLYLNKDQFYKSYYDIKRDTYDYVYRMSARWMYEASSNDELYNKIHIEGDNDYIMIHHTTFDHTNDDPDKLIRIGNKDHFRIHSEHDGLKKQWQDSEFRERARKRNRERIIDYNTNEKYAKSRQINSERASRQMKELVDKLWNPNNPEYYSDEMIERREKISKNQSEIMKKRQQENSWMVEENKKRWSDREYKERTSKSISKVLSDGRLAGENNPAYGRKWIYNPETGDVKFLKKIDCKEYLDQGWEYGKNHEVHEVRFTNYRENVYGLQVDTNHNYALSSGVFVSNTIWEAGYARGVNKPIVYFAETLGNNNFNLMLAQSGSAVALSRDMLKTILSDSDIVRQIISGDKVSEYSGQIE